MKRGVTYDPDLKCYTDFRALHDQEEAQRILDRITNAPGVESKAETTNPKDLVGNTKVSLTKLPAIASIMGAMAMMDGATKYGPYNWRAKKVIASIYVDAALRHFYSWLEGQETASDSQVHHLGHVIACCGILLDAQRTGNLVDDRPAKESDDLADLLTELSEVIKKKASQ